MMDFSKKKKIILVAGTRPNFMKIAPIMEELNKYPSIESILVHTGQHYDRKMSQLFFHDLNLPQSNRNLGVGTASYAVQINRMIGKLKKFFKEHKPGLVIVVGDVNSTLAGTLAAYELSIPLAHVEAGLRSFDLSMPEENNRILTDAFCNFLFTTCEEANRNLKREGICKDNIYFVGNVMIDTLLRLMVKAGQSKILKKLKLKRRDYVVLTLHRPSSVDDRRILRSLFEAFDEIGRCIPIIFPVHPRTRKQMERFKIRPNTKYVRLNEPLGYLDFLGLFMNSKFVMTDSGGIQEEATVLKIPCLTLRDNTERPITISKGTNILVGTGKQKIIEEAMKILEGKAKKGSIPKYWDGKTAQRIVKVLKGF